MGKKTSNAIANILNDIDATEDEKAFLDYAKVASPADTNYPLIVSLFVLTKQIAHAAEDLVRANQETAYAENRNSTRLTALIFILIGMLLMQGAGIFFALFK